MPVRQLAHDREHEMHPKKCHADIGVQGVDISTPLPCRQIHAALPQPPVQGSCDLYCRLPLPNLVYPPNASSICSGGKVSAPGLQGRAQALQPT